MGASLHSESRNSVQAVLTYSPSAVGGETLATLPDVTEAGIDPQAPADDVPMAEVSSYGQEAVPPNFPAKDFGGKLKEEHKVSVPVAPGTAISTEASEPRLASVPGYFSGQGLSQQAKLLSEIFLEYPVAAGVREGHVTLRILVSEVGAIDDLAVLKADPKGFFEDAALSAFAHAKFAPGELLGTPVKSQFVVEIEFVPINRGGVSGRGY